MPVLLRFFEQRDFRSIGNAIGTTEDGARMRVNRALEKLRGLLQQKGTTLTVTALGATLTANVVSAAPVGLAGKVSVVALGGSAAGAGIAGIAGKWFSLSGALKAAALLGALGIAAILIHTPLSGIRSKIEASRLSQMQALTNTANSSSAPANSVITRRKGSSTAPSATAANLENLKRELSALLEHPEARTTFPPRELQAVLRRFGDQWLEAMPVLLERGQAADYETRHWALYGVWDLLVNSHAQPGGSDPDRRDQAIALARPVLSKLLLATNEPIDLRRVAVEALVPSVSARIISPAGEQDIALPLLDPATLADIVALLQSNDRASEGFRYELIDPTLRRQAGKYPEVARTLREALSLMLEQGDRQQQLLAAYGLAMLTGEKSAEIRQVLVKGLSADNKDGGLYSYRAANALGAMVPAAAEAVPALLQLAETAKNWGASGYREHALEAACRIRPDLRAQYPETDAKLRAEEDALKQEAMPTPLPVVKRFKDLGEALADVELQTNMLRSLAGQIYEATDPTAKRKEIMEQLMNLWAKAPAEHRDAIQLAMEQLRALPEPPAPKKPVPVSMRSLLADVRVVLLDPATGKRPPVEEFCNEQEQWYRDHAVDSEVTVERLAALSASLKQLDPGFQEAWLKEIVRHNPGLDRTLRGEKP